MRLALGLEYDGSTYCGWQTQPNGCAIQDHLEGALASFCGTAVATVCAGRTDAGVHATYQVVHLDAPVERALESWVRGVNRFLPAAIAVRWARDVEPSFHARYGAAARRYDYWLLNDPVRSPLARARAGWVFRPLDAEKMDAAAQSLVGRHDFSSFRAAECQADNPERDLRELRVVRLGRYLRIRVVANAFLQHMVRNIVGSLVEVGVGRRPATWVGDVLSARDRRQAAPTFPADGLYLTGVDYDPKYALPAPLETYPQHTHLQLP